MSHLLKPRIVAGSSPGELVVPQPRLIVWYRGYGGPEDRFGGFPASALRPDFQIHLYQNGTAEIHYGQLFDEDYSFQASLAAGLYNNQGDESAAPGFPDTANLVEIDAGTGGVDDWTYGFPADYFVNQGWRCKFPKTAADYADASWESIPYAPVTNGPWTNVPDPGLPLEPQPTDGPDAYPITLPFAVRVGAGRPAISDWWIGWDGMVKAVPAGGFTPRNADYGYMPEEPEHSYAWVGVSAMAAQIVTYGYNIDSSVKTFDDLSPGEQARVPDRPVRYSIRNA